MQQAQLLSLWVTLFFNNLFIHRNDQRDDYPTSLSWFKIKAQETLNEHAMKCSCFHWHSKLKFCWLSLSEHRIRNSVWQYVTQPYLKWTVSESTEAWNTPVWILPSFVLLHFYLRINSAPSLIIRSCKRGRSGLQSQLWMTAFLPQHVCTMQKTEAKLYLIQYSNICFLMQV